MNSKEIEEIILQKSIIFYDNGIDFLPGKTMRIESEQINIDGKVIDIRLLIWYELTKEGNQPERPNAYIIYYRTNYIISEYFYEAIAIFNHLIKKYTV